MRYSVAKEVEAISGRDVRLEMEVCSDPRPSKTVWDWGTLRVEAGQDVQGRFLSEQLVEHPEREDCYFARLHVKQVNPIQKNSFCSQISIQILNFRSAQRIREDTFWTLKIATELTATQFP